MKLSRDFTRIIHFVLDELLPPIVRDSRWFMYLMLRLGTGRHAHDFLDFKATAHALSEAEFSAIYERTYGILGRETDLNQACLRKIPELLLGSTVLEGGCGNGYLAGRLAAGGKRVTAADIRITKEVCEQHPNVTFVERSVEALDASLGTFDTVVCTHTLEHVRDLPAAIAALRARATKRLIIVVPAQRPYRYTFDLHLHFFPYEFQFIQAVRPPAQCEWKIEKAGGDWLYVETYLKSTGTPQSGTHSS